MELKKEIIIGAFGLVGALVAGYFHIKAKRLENEKKNAESQKTHSFWKGKTKKNKKTAPNII